MANGNRIYPLHCPKNGEKAVERPYRSSYKSAETPDEIERRVVKGPGSWADDCRTKTRSGLAKIVDSFGSKFDNANNKRGAVVFSNNRFKHGYGRNKKVA